MPNILVCYKWVIEENDISVDFDGDLKMREPAYKVSLYDRNAIEAAVQLSEKTEMPCIALTCGDAKAEKSRKEALCAGPDQGYAVIDDALESADSYLTATVLASAIKKIGDIDVVLCGEGSGDMYAQQVGPRIAGALGWPLVAYATEIEPCEGGLQVKRAGADGIEILKASMPIVITVAGDCNTPRIAGIKAVMGAGKKPFEVFSLADVGIDGSASGLSVKQVIGNRPDRKNIRIQGDSSSIAAELVKSLIGEGVLG